MPGILQGPGPFARWGYEKVYGSDLLNPSNCTIHRVQDNGSIRASIQKADLLMTREKEVNWTVYAKKTVRGIARYVAITGVIVLLPPVGVAVNSLGLVADLTLWGRAKIFKVGRAEDYSHSAGLRIWAIITDATVFICFGAMNAAAFALSLHKNTPLRYRFIPLLLFSINLPAFAALLVCYQSERAAWLKSLSLRNDWGIVSSTGKLLKADIELDKEDLRTTQFYKLYEDLSEDILMQIQSIQKLLPANQKMRQHYPPRLSAISSDSLKATAGTANEAEVRDRLALLAISFQRMEKMRTFLKESREAELDSLMNSNGRPNVEIEYPFQNSNWYSSFFNAQQGLGGRKAHQERANNRESQHNPASYSENRYHVRWASVQQQFNTSQEAWTVLRIAKDASEEAIKTAWKNLIRERHPDKHNNSAQATELFKLTTSAKDAMLILRGNLDG